MLFLEKYDILKTGYWANPMWTRNPQEVRSDDSTSFVVQFYQNPVSAWGIHGPAGTDIYITDRIGRTDVASFVYVGGRTSHGVRELKQRSELI